MCSNLPSDHYQYSLSDSPISEKFTSPENLVPDYFQWFLSILKKLLFSLVLSFITLHANRLCQTMKMSSLASVSS